MKKLILTTLAIVIVLFAATLAQANSIPITVQANVPYGSPSCSIAILRLDEPNPPDPWAVGLQVSTMNYGELTHFYTNQQGQQEESGHWYAKYYFMVFVYSTSFGHRYQIDSHFEGLTGVSTGRVLPQNCMGLTPWYEEDDKWKIGGDPQGPQPMGSELGNGGQMESAYGDNMIYRSEIAASNHILRGIYGIPTYDEFSNPPPIPGWEETGRIELSYPQDMYRGTVTITMVEAT